MGVLYIEISSSIPEAYPRNSSSTSCDNQKYLLIPAFGEVTPVEGSYLILRFAYLAALLYQNLGRRPQWIPVIHLPKPMPLTLHFKKVSFMVCQLCQQSCY